MSATEGEASAAPRAQAAGGRAPAAEDAPDPDGGYDLERDFAWATHDVRRLIARIFDRHMKELGLTQAQGRVLAALKRQDGLTQTEIADMLDMERAPLGRLVDRLEEAGFVERRPDAADRRVRRVYLRPRSRAVTARMEAMGPAIFDAALEGVSRAELEAVTAVLLRIKANLMAQEAGRAAAPGED